MQEEPTTNAGHVVSILDGVGRIVVATGAFFVVIGGPERAPVLAYWTILAGFLLTFPRGCVVVGSDVARFRRWLSSRARA